MRTIAAVSASILLSGQLWGAEGDSSGSVRLPPLVIKRPLSDNWQLLRDTDTNVIWRRKDGAVAYVNVGRWPPPKDDAAFAAEMKKNAEELISSIPQARIVEARHTPTRERGYPCMHSRLLVTASVSPAPNAPEQPVDIHYRMLACHSLNKDKYAFFAGFSYPSKVFDAEAEGFLRGVRVEPKPK